MKDEKFESPVYEVCMAMLKDAKDIMILTEGGKPIICEKCKHLIVVKFKHEKSTNSPIKTFCGCVCCENHRKLVSGKEAVNISILLRNYFRSLPKPIRRQ